MKKLLLLLLSLGIVYVLWTNGFLSQVDKKHSETSNDWDSTQHIPSHSQDHENIQKVHDQPIDQASVNFQTEHKYYVSKCGVERFDDFYFNELKKDNNNLNDLSEEQIKALDYLISDEFCGNWYRYVDNLTDVERNNLVQHKNETALAADAFDTLEDEEKSIISKDVLKNKNNDINKRIALNHLLTKDWDFIKQVADEINTTNLSLITDSSFKVIQLFECQENPEICSAQSSQMLSFCVFNVSHCNLRYEEYLERKHTYNEVSDYYNILAAIRRILNIQ